MSDFDLTALPDQPMTSSQFDLSALPDQPGNFLTGEPPPTGMMPDLWQDETVIPPADAQPLFTLPTGPPQAPPELWRENATDLKQAVWNYGKPPTMLGPNMEHELRPDVTHATGLEENLGAGLLSGINHVVSNLISLPAGLTPESARQSQESTGFGKAFPTRADIFNSTLTAMNKALQVDKLMPPEDFADSLARGAGESVGPLAETFALSYLTAGTLSPLTAGIAQKIPYLYSWLFPVARDAITFGTQSALEPGATLKSAEVGAGAGAALGLLGPYGRITRAIGGASIGMAQEYAGNPQAGPLDYARSAALMGAFAAIGAAHGITADEAAAFTIVDWAKGKGYSAEAISRSLKVQGIGPLANEMAEDVTQQGAGNRSQEIGKIGPSGSDEEMLRSLIDGTATKPLSEVSDTPEAVAFFPQLRGKGYIVEPDPTMAKWEKAYSSPEAGDWFVDPADGSFVQRGYFIYKDPSVLDKFREIREMPDGQAKDDAFGRLYGYSEADIQAFQEHAAKLAIPATTEGAETVLPSETGSASLEPGTSAEGAKSPLAEPVPELPPGSTPIPQPEDNIILFRNVGPDTTQAVSEVTNNLLELARPAGLKRFWQKAQDAVSIDPVPKMARVGNFLADKAVEHASARIAAPKMVDNLLSSVFPDAYRNPEEMARTMDILVKDNVLAGYDEFMRRSGEAKKAGNVAEADKWSDAAHAIAREHDVDAYDAQVKAAQNDPVISGNIERWKRFVNPYLDQLFNEMKRVDPGTEREGRGRYFDARINLTSLDRATQLAEWMGEASKPLPSPAAASYRNPNVPKDQFDRSAKFTGQYTTDARIALLNAVAGRWNKVTELRFYDALVQSGAAVLQPSGGPRPAEIQGQRAVSLPVRLPFTEVLQDGTAKATRVNSYDLIVRSDLLSEVRAVQGTDLPISQNSVAKILTTIQLTQIADAVTHAKNIMTVVTRAQGAGSAWKDVVRKMPIFGTGDALVRISHVAREVMSDSPAIRAEIADMAMQGLIRPEYPATGVQKITHGQEFLHAMDTAARVVMNRFFDNLVERGLGENTQANRRGYINQVGMYNARLQGPIMRALKSMGLSPFIVAGRNFNVQGFRGLTGNPGVTAPSTGAALQMRLTNMAGTVLTMSVVPMILNTLTTGTPMGRTGTPVGAWDLNGEENEKGQHRVIDLLQLTGLRRGMRVTGLDALVEGLRHDHTTNQIAGQAWADTTSSQLHPWMGPAPGFVAKMLTGKQLDVRGFMEAQRIPEGGGRQYVENMRAALESQNPLIYAAIRPLFQEMGLDQKPDKGYGEHLSETFLKSPYGAAGVKNVYPAKSAAEEMVASILRGNQGYEPGEQEHAELKRQIRVLIRAGKPIPEELQERYDELSKGEEKALEGAEDTTQLQASFALLRKIDHMIEVIEVATPEERADLEDIFSKRANSAIKNAAPAMQEALEKRVDAAMNMFDEAGTSGTTATAGQKNQ